MRQCGNSCDHPGRDEDLCAACGDLLQAPPEGRFEARCGYTAPVCAACWEDESGDSWPEWASGVIC